VPRCLAVGVSKKTHHQPVDRIAKDTQFGNVSLLDGSAGTNAVTNGANLQFIGVSENHRVRASTATA